MISNPKNGWCNFDLGTFHRTPSYLTDIPVDLLDAFIQYHYARTGIVWFDGEDTGFFTLVIVPGSLFIIEENDGPILHDFSELSIKDLEKELIEDIEKDLTGWFEFTIIEDKKETIKHEKEIRKKLSILKKLNG